MILAVNQTMKVAMEARTRQQKEFSWTTCLAMLRKSLESLAVSQEAVAASVSGDELVARQQNQLVKRGLPGASAREPKVSLQR